MVVLRELRHPGLRLVPVVDRDDVEALGAVLLLQLFEVGSLPTTGTSPDTPEDQVRDLAGARLVEVGLLAVEIVEYEVRGLAAEELREAVADYGEAVFHLSSAIGSFRVYLILEVLFGVFALGAELQIVERLVAFRATRILRQQLLQPGCAAGTRSAGSARPTAQR